MNHSLWKNIQPYKLLQQHGEVGDRWDVLTRKREDTWTQLESKVEKFLTWWIRADAPQTKKEIPELFRKDGQIIADEEPEASYRLIKRSGDTVIVEFDNNNNNIADGYDIIQDGRVTKSLKYSYADVNIESVTKANILWPAEKKTFEALLLKYPNLESRDFNFYVQIPTIIEQWKALDNEIQSVRSVGISIKDRFGYIRNSDKEELAKIITTDFKYLSDPKVFNAAFINLDSRYKELFEPSIVKFYTGKDTISNITELQMLARGLLNDMKSMSMEKLEDQLWSASIPWYEAWMEKNIQSFFVKPTGAAPLAPWVRGTTAVQREDGGYNFELYGNERYTKFQWKKTSLSAVTNQSFPNYFSSPNEQVNVLEWEMVNEKWRLERGKIVVSNNPQSKWVLSICESWAVTQLNFKPGSATPVKFAWNARKPVIYIYPTKKQKVSVKLSLTGAKLAVEYPKSQKWVWTVTAHTDGTLTDTTTKKKYSSIFWEAHIHKPMLIDSKNAFCVSAKEVESFLEDALTTLWLNIKERNEFIVYWLPIMQNNKFSLVEFKTTEYTKMAKLDISPKPETLIRVFMVFQNSDKKVKTGTPKLTKAKRKGYTVVEWGGCNLDEKNTIK